MSARGNGSIEDAIEALYRARFRVFVRTAYAITGDAEAAREVVQEAFALALQRRRALRRQQALESWVWRIVVTRSLEARRRESRARLLPLPGPAAPSGVAEHSNGHDGELVRAVRSLPERQRLALFLRYYADLDYQRIGEVLGIADGTVAASLNAAHTTLKGRLRRDT